MEGIPKPVQKEENAEEAMRKAKEMVVDPSTGLITERENLTNPNA